MTTLLISSSISLVNCTTTQILDAEGCADKGDIGAHCAHTLTDEKRSLNKKDWDTLRFGWICMSPSDFTNTEKEIAQLCNANSKACDYQTKKLLNEILIRMGPLVGRNFEGDLDIKTEEPK